MQTTKRLPAIYPFIVTTSPPIGVGTEGLRYLPDAQGYLFQRRFEYDPDSEENAYERVFDDVWDAMPIELRDKDRIVLMGFSWAFRSVDRGQGQEQGQEQEEGQDQGRSRAQGLSRCCMIYSGYDEESFGKEAIRGIEEEIFDELFTGKEKDGFEEVKTASSVLGVMDSIGDNEGFALPPDLRAYCRKEERAQVIYTSVKGALIHFMQLRMEEMKPPWLYCGVRRRLVAKRLETMFSNEIESILALFQKKGIRTKPGMTNAQIEEAERCFGIVFPDDYRALLKAAVPVSQGFCDWADLSVENVRFIQGKIEDPIMDILFRVKQEPFNWNAWWFKVVGGGWPDAWGPRPEDRKLRMDIAKEKIKTAPPLIPVFGESYIPSVPSEDGNPVFDVSMVTSFQEPSFGCVSGLDIWNYFQREFAERPGPRPEIEMQFLKDVPFWSDLFG